MNARILQDDKTPLGEGRFTEIVIWETPEPKTPSTHPYKYRLAFIVDDVCVLRYDNESGKGDHRHGRGREEPYVFRSLKQLQRDFWRDVTEWEE